MMTLVQADGRLLQRIVATTPLVAPHGLSRDALAKDGTAQAKSRGRFGIGAGSHWSRPTTCSPARSGMT
jgi:hypothetical protein